MEPILRLGPLALPWATLLLVVSWIVGTALHERYAKRHGLASGARHSWLVALAVLAAARVGYVLYYPREYGAAPWSILDVRDGGWAPWWGVSALVAYLVFLWAARSPWRKSVTLGGVCALVLWLGASLALQRGAPSDAGHDDLPAWETVALDGSRVALPELRGRPVVVNLWASWCPPCRREMPVLLDARQRHPQVRFLWVNQGEDTPTARRYALGRHELPAADVLLDDTSQLGRMIGSHALPTTLFYDARGRLVATRTGELSAATLAERLALIAPTR
ncbi:MAG: TlpA disulfide reductase family protein [Comamonadaceae bacterium]|nr:TlpA family protein disulfide reductase [Burkholderiales bacterium]MEB2347957.1 TlpA disulfide reductase family protein [Comamonadaceae bacterium]